MGLSYKKILAILVILYCILSFGLLCQHMQHILRTFSSDDAFYYYSIAKNTVQGKGVVFNEGIPTNGFHPLYLILLLPLFALLYGLGENIPVYASLVMLILFNAGTAVFLYNICTRLLNKKAGLLASFVWLFNPFVLFVVLLGMEVPIQIFFISALIYFILVRREKFTFKDSAVAGLLLGLVFLSRMDGIFLFLGVFFALRKKHWKKLALMASVSFAVVMPWLLFSIFYVGRLMPVSGSALRLMRLSNTSHFEAIKITFAKIGNYIGSFFFEFTDSYFQLLIVILFLLIPVIFLIFKKDRVMLKTAKNLDFLIIATAFYFIFYIFFQLGIRQWNSLYISFILTILFSVGIIKFIEKTKLRYAAVALVLLLIFSFSFNGIKAFERGNNAQEQIKWGIAKTINIKDMEGQIGSFNTGILQYFTTNYDIINLDGVVNPEAYEAAKKGSIEQYILDKNITLLLDTTHEIERLNNPLLNITAKKGFKATPKSKAILYALAEVRPK